MTLGSGQEACKQGSHLGETQGRAATGPESRCFLRPALEKALGGRPGASAVDTRGRCLLVSQTHQLPSTVPGGVAIRGCGRPASEALLSHLATLPSPDPKAHWPSAPALAGRARGSEPVQPGCELLPPGPAVPAVPARAPRARFAGLLAPTPLVGRGLRGHQAPGCPGRCPLAPGKQKVRGPRGTYQAPLGHWVGGARGAHLLTTPPALQILRDTFTGGNSQRSEEGNG